jgi:hypothetical protein
MTKVQENTEIPKESPKNTKEQTLLIAFTSIISKHLKK